MFTGLVEDVGELMEISPMDGGVRIRVRTALPVGEMSLGESIAVDGACLTAVALDGDTFDVELSEETLRCTHFGVATRGDAVNLERALRFGARLGGHLVSGHVDGVGTLAEIVIVGEGFEVTWELPEELLPEVVTKGSITIDGVSLTVSRLEGRRATAAIIPHTAEHTTITSRTVGSPVHVESDVIGKYVRRVLGQLTAESRESLGSLFDDTEVPS
jgi:riboflavin synthase